MAANIHCNNLKVGPHSFINGSKPMPKLVCSSTLVVRGIVPVLLVVLNRLTLHILPQCDEPLFVFKASKEIPILVVQNFLSTTTSMY